MIETVIRGSYIHDLEILESLISLLSLPNDRQKDAQHRYAIKSHHYGQRESIIDREDRHWPGVETLILSKSSKYSGSCATSQEQNDQGREMI